MSTAKTLGRILVVDDDRNLLELMQMRLEASGYEVTTTPDEDRALDLAEEETFDLAVIDLQLDRRNGIAVMEDLHRITPGLPAIILTAHGSIESAVEAMKKGAFSYLTKPFDPRELTIQIERALETKRLSSEVERLKEMVEERYAISGVIARSAAMRKVLEQVSRIAGTDSTVLIRGESGTGKELVARAIHLGSPRRDRPFVEINCAALPETLLESELFGHEKGAFTGAVRRSRGLFAHADGGTIFLDEVGDMPLPLQAKLLRVLQEKRIRPVGGEVASEIDVRVVAATNKDLEQEVREGRFRKDLYYRIHVIPVHLPPLRERKEDIIPLADHFLRRFAGAMKKKIKGFTPGAVKKLTAHHWPGNVRELENTIEYAVAMTDRATISEALILYTGSMGEEPLLPLKEARDAFEREYLKKLLRSTSGNVSRSADLAGKYRADLYNLLKKHNLSPADFKKKKK